MEVEPLGEARVTAAEGVESDGFWMLALLFRLEPKPRLLKRELMTSTWRRDAVLGEQERERARRKRRLLLWVRSTRTVAEGGRWSVVS